MQEVRRGADMIYSNTLKSTFAYTCCCCCCP